jgi:DICT domain-containing protein
MGAGFSLFDWVSAQAAMNGEPSDGLIEDAVHLQMRTQQHFTASVRGMLHWCRLNERLVAHHHANHADVYAGVERFSRLGSALPRYREISRVVHRLTIFGCPDVPLPLYASKVAVPDDHPFAREWFLIVNAPAYKALISARDLDGFGAVGPLAHRRFSGIALHSDDVVLEACERLDAEAAQLSRPCPI